MLRKIDSGMELAYESVGGKSSMTVGNVKPGDLDGAVRKSGPKGSGAKETGVKKPEEAPAELQGDTVEDSKKGKKGIGAFDRLYKSVVKEEVSPSIESDKFDPVSGDFPPAGEEEADAEDFGAEGDMEADEGSAFSKLADLFSQAAELFSQMAAEHGGADAGEELIDGEGDLGAEGDVAKEAVESKPAPDGVSKLTGKGNIDVKGVKVERKTAVVPKGKGADGAIETGKDTNLGPKMSQKASGTGPIASGKNSNFFG